jgi:hypothetical protein
MLQQKLKLGLPEEAPAPAPVAPTTSTPAPPLDAFDALKPLLGRQRAIMRGLSASSKQQVADNAAQRKAAGIAHAEGLAADSPAINEQGGLKALGNPEFTKRGSQLLSAASVMRRLTAQPADEAGTVSDAPASPAISALMQKLQGQSVGPSPAPAPAEAPAMPEAPMIAKINKKLNGKVKETPHPEEDQPYTPIPEEGLWRKHLRPNNGQTQDQMVADQELSSYGPKVREKYGKNVIENRALKRDIAEEIANEHTPEDAQAATDMYHQIDHRSRRSEARKAIKHYANLMSPAARSAVEKRFTDEVMKAMWHRE